MSIFSVVNAILLHPLAYKDPGRIAMVWIDNHKLGVDQDWHSYPSFMEYKTESQTFEDVAAFNDRSFNLTGAGDPVRVIGAWATASLFPILGVDPAIGRTFTSDEEEPGHDLVVVLSHGLWQRRFGADPNIIGQQISLNGTGRIVVGVMPASFSFPDKDAELWIPPGGRPAASKQSECPLAQSCWSPQAWCHSRAGSSRYEHNRRPAGTAVRVHGRLRRESGSDTDQIVGNVRALP